MKTGFTLSVILCATLLHAASIDQDLGGFEDETPKSEAVSGVETTDAIMDGFEDETPKSETASTVETSDGMMDGFEDEAVGSSEGTASQDEIESEKSGLTGKLTEQIAYSLNTDAPHNNISSVKSSLLLDYEYKFENGFKFKTNAKAYYDAIYDIRGTEKFAQDELDELKSEVRLFDAYLEGSITDTLDFKVGRQVVVWGRSDTIRVTDVLNPLDNRRPGMVDIEDLRLPVAMAKFDYFIDDWRITPIVIVEQHFSINPPFGSVFYPAPVEIPGDESYNEVTYALSVGAEFSGWDVNFYAAHLLNDEGQLAFTPQPVIEHESINMFGTALNILSGSWLFKTELAYFDGLEYFSTGDKEFARTDILLGAEYNGIANTLISYDIVSRNIDGFDPRLKTEIIPLKKNDYQHAFRVSSDFMNATVTANYLISLYGEKLDEGGFQRAWVKYEVAQGVNANVGIVDYIGGSVFFDAIKDNDMVFADISYSF